MEEMRREMAVTFQTRQVDSRMRLFAKLITKHGPELVDDVKNHIIEETAARFAETEFDQRDLAGVKAYLWEGLGTGFSFECVEDSPSRLSYRVHRCFLAEAAAKHNLPELGYAFYCAWDEGFCRGLNPRIKFTRTQTLMQGDPCCDHTYQLDPPRQSTEDQ